LQALIGERSIVDEKCNDPKADPQEPVEETFGDIGPHCGLDLIIYYRQGKLLPVERGTVQEHLSRCTECTRLFLELRDFEALEEDQPHSIPSSIFDEEFYTFLRRIKPLLPAMLRTYRISGEAATEVLEDFLFEVVPIWDPTLDTVDLTLRFMSLCSQPRHRPRMGRPVGVELLLDWLYLSSEESSADTAKENAVLKELLLEWWFYEPTEESPAHDEGEPRNIPRRRRQAAPSRRAR
jgi:hypothetical protein